MTAGKPVFGDEARNYQKVLAEDGLHVLMCPISGEYVSVQIKDGYPVKLGCDDYVLPDHRIDSDFKHCLYNENSNKRRCIFDRLIILQNPCSKDWK